MALYGAGNGGSTYATTPAWRKPLSGQIRTTTPVTMSWWFAGYTNAGDNGMVFIIDPVNLWCVGGFGTGGSLLGGQFNNSAGSAYFNSGSILNTQTWQHFMCSWNGIRTARMWINAVPSAFPTDSMSGPIADGIYTEVQVLESTPSNVGAPTNAKIAEVAIWSGITFADSEAIQLYTGANPLTVAANKLLDYWPLRGDLRNEGMSRIGLAPTHNPATVWGDHPLVMLPPRRRAIAHRVAAAPPTVRPRISMVA